MSALTNSIGSGITDGVIVSLVAVGFTLIVLATGVINFANGQFMVIGGYIGYVLYAEHGVPFIIAVAAAVAGGALVGVLTDRIVIAPVRGRSLLIQVMALIALTSVLNGVFLLIFGSDDTIIPPYLSTLAVVPGLGWSWLDVSILGVTGVVMALLITLLYRTELGLTMRGTAR